MKLDRLDFETLDALDEGGQENFHTTTEVAKDVFEDTDGARIQNLDSRIRARLQKLVKYGIVVKDEDGSANQYNINYHDVVYGTTDMDVNDSLSDQNGQYSFNADKMLFISNDEGITIRGFINPENGDAGLEYYMGEEDAGDKLNDPEWLRAQYVDERNAPEEIAESLDVPVHHVKNWIHHFGLHRQEVVAKLDDPEWLEEKLDEDYTPVEIAKLLDCDYVTVYNYMVKHGVEAVQPKDQKWENSQLRTRLKRAGIWNGECWLCGEEKSGLQVHRLLPACKGGDDHADNLAILCSSCHSKRVHDGDELSVSTEETRKIIENHPLYN